MKDLLSSTAAPTVALPTAGTGLSQLTDLAAALNHIGKPDGRYLVAIKDDAEPTDPEYFRFVSPAERVDLMVDRRFIILEPKRLESLIGHPVLKASNGCPILGDNERKMVAAMLTVEDGVIRNPNLTMTEKHSVLDKIKAELKPALKGFMIENYGIKSMTSGVDPTQPPSSWTPFEDKMKKFSTDQIEQLLGRKIERGVNKKHVLSDPEADFLGLALGMHEAIQAEPGSRQRQIRFGACIKKCAELHGGQAAKRLARFLRKELGHKIEKLTGELGEIKAAKAAATEMSEWINKPLVLERPDGSRLHDVRQKLLDESVVILYTELLTGNPGILNDGNIHGFVVEHDWAKAFEGAGEFDAGEFSLPYTVSFFEFQVTGRRVGIVVVQDDRGATMVPFFAWSGGWSLLPAYELDVGTGKVSVGDAKSDVALGILRLFLPLMELLAKNVRAVCISLEAEVAESTVVRADHRLNRAREKRGKLPLHDYHVVSLAHRSRVPSLPKNEMDPDREITRRRCHFRRGHWRHYENHKTWIKWCLVGDPDLGFVDKHYKL